MKQKGNFYIGQFFLKTPIHQYKFPPPILHLCNNGAIFKFVMIFILFFVCSTSTVDSMCTLFIFNVAILNQLSLLHVYMRVHVQVGLVLMSDGKAKKLTDLSGKFNNLICLILIIGLIMSRDNIYHFY